MTNAWMAHGMCYLWTPWMIQWQVLGDLGIAFSYFTIPVILYVITVHRPKMPGLRTVHWFMAFVALCGLTHLLEIVTIWQPFYVLTATVKSITAIVSVCAVWNLAMQLRQLFKAIEQEDIRALVEEWRNACTTQQSPEDR